MVVKKKIDQKIINKLKNYKDFNYIHSDNLSYVDRIKFASKKFNQNMQCVWQKMIF